MKPWDFFQRKNKKVCNRDFIIFWRKDNITDVYINNVCKLNENVIETMNLKDHFLWHGLIKQKMNRPIPESLCAIWSYCLTKLCIYNTFEIVSLINHTTSYTNILVNERKALYDKWNWIGIIICIDYVKWILPKNKRHVYICSNALSK